MRRAAYRRPTQGVALFPFLAVLICTMGSLIVLLVLVLQNSRSQAAAVVADKAAAERQDAAEQTKRVRAQVEEADWRREMLEQQRKDQLEDLGNRRKELSHLEDHIRRLEDQWKQIREKLLELQRLKDDKQATDQASQEEIDKLRDAVAAAKKKLDEARQKKSDKPQAFAIIPYVGKSGTRRRPIYIECAEEGIILYPERVMFMPSDFQGSLGPGNPLDAALRTVREYWAQHGDPKRDGEPYPLLIVRPNGSVAYSMARAAMRSWDEEFGYELIEDDMKLTFPPPDPQLEALIMRSITDARQRQTALAAAMPSRYRPGPGDALVASPNGGFVAAPPRGATTGTGRANGSGSGGTGAGAGRGGIGGTGPNGPAGRGFGANGSGGAGTGNAGVGGAAFDGTGAGGTGTGGASDGSGSFGGGSNGSGSGGFGSGGTGSVGTGSGGAGSTAGSGQGLAGTNGANGNRGGGTGPSAGGSGGAPGGTASVGSMSGAGGGYAGGSGMGGMFTSHDPSQDGAAGQGAGNAPSGSNSSGRTGGNSRSGGGSGSSASANGYSANRGSANQAANQTGGNGGSAGGGGAASGASSGAGSQAGSAGQGGVQTDGSSSPNGGHASATFSPQSLAQSRGRDWALMGKSQQATAITRPIRVRCQAKQLTLLPERGVDGRPQTIAHGGDVGGSIEPFVTAVRKHMDGWGLAVANGYWKPVLNVQVDPDAENQFKQLESLLRDSGYEVVRKTTR